MPPRQCKEALGISGWLCIQGVRPPMMAKEKARMTRNTAMDFFEEDVLIEPSPEIN